MCVCDVDDGGVLVHRGPTYFCDSPYTRVPVPDAGSSPYQTSGTTIYYGKAQHTGDLI